MSATLLHTDPLAFYSLTSPLMLEHRLPLFLFERLFRTFERLSTLTC